MGIYRRCIMANNNSSAVVYFKDIITKVPANVLIKGVAVEATNFINPHPTTSTSKSSISKTYPSFFLKVCEELEGKVGKEEVQRRAVEQLKADHPAAYEALCPNGAADEKAARQYMARFFEQGGVGYAQNPGWIALFVMENDGGRRFARKPKKGEEIQSVSMLTRTGIPGQGGAKKPTTKDVALAHLAEQLANENNKAKQKELQQSIANLMNLGKKSVESKEESEESSK